MAVLVFATILATSAVTVPLTYLIARRPRPVMPHRQRVLLGESMALLAQLANPTDLDRVDVLSDRSKEAAVRLLAKYQKEINR